MKYLNAEKYNLAWFKLAECVSRGEKERALGVYRLLSHSVGSDGLAKQLAGDLLLCFDEKEKAMQEYKKSAEIYKKQGAVIEAIAVYEHLIILNSDSQDDVWDACCLYAHINMPFKIVYHIDKLIKNSKLDFVVKLMKKYGDSFEVSDCLKLNQELSLALIRDKTHSREFVFEQLNRTLDKFLAQDDLLLNDFLFLLELEDEKYHKHAYDYLQEKA